MAVVCEQSHDDLFGETSRELGGTAEYSLSTTGIVGVPPLRRCGLGLSENGTDRIHRLLCVDLGESESRVHIKVAVRVEASDRGDDLR